MAITNELKKTAAEVLVAIASEYLEQQKAPAQQAQQPQQSAPKAQKRKYNVAEVSPRVYTDQEIKRIQAQCARRDKREAQQQAQQHVRRELHNNAPSYMHASQVAQQRKMGPNEVFQEGYAAGVASLGITLLGGWLTNKATIWVENFFKKEAGLRS